MDNQTRQQSPQDMQPYPSQPNYPHSFPQQQQAYVPPRTEEWILLNRELHFGFVKETFRRGAVITHDVTNNKLIIDGRVFNDTRDIDILKRYSKAHPDTPWIIPFSEDSLEFVLSGSANPLAADVPQKQTHRKMEVVTHDTTDISPIPIGHTRVAANNAAAKVAAKNAPMEIIRGDETVEDRIAAHESSIEARIAELEGKTDIASIAERAKLKANNKPKMKIVRDDSLGHSGGSKSASLNAGQSFPSVSDAEARRADAQAQADARKRQVEAARVASGVPQQEYQPPQRQAQPDASLYDEMTPIPQSAPVQRGTEERINALENGQNQILAMLGKISSSLGG